MSLLKKIFTPNLMKIYFYMFASILTMILAFITNWMMTRIVHPSVYGQYKYATNFLLTIPAIFGFGIHFGCSRIIAERKTGEKDGIVFASVVIVALIGVIVSAGLYLINFLSNIFAFSIGALEDIKVVFPFMILFTTSIVIAQVYQGTGKTNQLAVFNLAQYIIVLIGLFGGRVFFDNLSFNYIILLYCFSWIIVMLPILMQVNYSFEDFRKNLGILYRETKVNGMYIYFGSIVTSGSSSVISLISGSIYGFVEYGYYSLALSFAQTFTLISSTMAIVKFKENVSQKYIPERDIQLMIGLNVFVYVIFLIVVKPAFMLFFTNDYLPTINYLIILGIVYSLNGMILYFNRYFIARGLGSQTMKNSIFVAIINIIISLLLIPRFKIMGIVYSALISSIFSLLKYIHSYKQYIKR